MPEIDVPLTDDGGAALVDEAGAPIIAASYSYAAAAPTFSADDFQAALLALLPFGPVWPKDTDSVQATVAAGLAPTYARMTGRAAALVADAPTGTLNERLPDWEASLGLPDPCAGPSPTLAQRQLSVIAKIAARGGQSIPYVQMLLVALGRTGTVTEFAPARIGLIEMDQPLYGPEWAHVWEVVVDPVPAGSEADVATDAVVECVLGRMSPAHTRLIVTFPDPYAASGAIGLMAIGEGGIGIQPPP